MTEAAAWVLAVAGWTAWLVSATMHRHRMILTREAIEGWQRAMRSWHQTNEALAGLIRRFDADPSTSPPPQETRP